MLGNKWVHIGALLVGGYLVFVSVSADGNTPFTDMTNLFSPSTGTSASDIGLLGWAGFGLLGFGAVQLLG
jgi:hypothetical protein